MALYKCFYFLTYLMKLQLVKCSPAATDDVVLAYEMKPFIFLRFVHTLNVNVSHSVDFIVVEDLH